MEIYERIKELRKKHLDISQTEFAEKLGVTRSVINNIERNVLARPDQKEPFYRLICSTFGVSYDWLINGKEPMFLEQSADYIEKLAEKYNGDDLFKNIIGAFLKLTDAEKAAVLKFIDSLEPDPKKAIPVSYAASSKNDEVGGKMAIPEETMNDIRNMDGVSDDDDL